MAKLESIKDLDIPKGLFPKEETKLIERIRERALQFYGDNSIELIGMYKTCNLLDTMKTMVADLIPRLGDAILEIKEESELLPEEKQLQKNEKEKINEYYNYYNFSLFRGRIGDIKPSLENDSLFDEETLKRKDVIQSLFASLAISEYFDGIQKAIQIKKRNGSQNNSYFRLGKTYKYFDFANNVLLYIEKANHELHGISHKENAVISKRKTTSKKGGKKRTARYEPLKEKVFSLYKEKYQKRSNRDAAHRIAKDLAEDIASVMQTEEPEITIAKWIGQFKKKTVKQNT